MIRIVLEAPRYHNQLSYNTKTSEYIYKFRNRVVWKEKADDGLYKYMVNVHNGTRAFARARLKTFPIYVKYAESCQQNVKEK